MNIERHSIDYWIKNKSIDFSIKEINGKVKVHRHEFYEIELILSGGGIYTIDGIDYKINRGSLFAMSPISFHNIVFKENSKLINLMFTLNSCNADFLTNLFINQPHFVMNLSENDIVFLEKLAEEAVNSNHLSICIPYVTSILDCFLGKINNLLNCDNPQNKISGIQFAILYIQNNFTKKITLKDIAKIANYSPNYFCSSFKKFTGVTFIDYLNELRFSYAKKLLLNTNHSASEIAERCGFNDFSYFMKTFKSRHGVTTKMYRERYGEK